MKNNYFFSFPPLFFLVFFIFSDPLTGQNPCDPITPIFTVNLTGQPNGTWTSTPVPRAGNCCGTLPPDKCIEFIITLDSAAVAINFQIVSGAVPPGALFYQIGCGPQIPVGSPICLNGPGPYILTFCKPGNNINTYAITSIAGPAVSPDDTIGNGCSTTMYASGLLIDNTISWNSIAPGSFGQYNSYLACTIGCDSTLVTAQPGAPPYVDYVVCGTPTAGACVSSGQWCDTIRIHFTPPIITTITPNPAIFCASNTAGVSLSSTVTGGVAPYTYSWTNSAGTVVGTGSTYTATAAGTYSLTVYDQNYPECPPATTTVSVIVDPVPVVNAGPDQSVCGTSVALSGSVSGATGGIWSGGNGTFSPSNTALNATYTPTAAELTTGTIILTLTSTGNGSCTPVTDQVVIQISPPISVTLTAPTVVCFGQTATITANVTGGIPPYSYLWNSGQTTQTISNVPPGTYSVSVTGGGAGTCVGTASVVIVANPQIIVNTSPNNSISCATTATISATATGGTGQLNYLWSNGATTQSTVVYSGTYVITVTDAVGCTANNSVSVLAANSSLTATINQPPVLCNGATTTLTTIANGGFGNYSYSWSNGPSTSSIVTGAGNYCCTVTDGAGCITSACVSVTQNPALNVTIPAPSAICFGASTSIYANASGGQPSYTYNWSTGQTTQSITAAAGNYTVTVGDMIGCTASATVTVTQSTVLSPNASFTPPSCFGGNNGTASANVTGGTSPYFYSWSPYGGSSSTATGLMAGSFTVTVTDAIGCSASSTVTVTQPSAISASVVVNNNVSCNGGSNGSVTVNPSGGTPGYFYSWSPAGGTGQSASNLVSGTYFVTITDANGCTQTAQANITQPPVLVASVSTTSPVSCNGGSDGSATVAAGGGTPGYTYSWSPSGGINATASNLQAGNYIATVTDANGCQVQATATVTQPPALSASVSSSSNVSCNGGSNGTATAAASGGTAPYTYSWNTTPVQTTQTASNLPAGNYIVTVTDAEGCIASSTAATITQPSSVTVTATPTSFISCTSTVSISASSSGGTPGYTYLWSTGATTSSITVNTGTYLVTVSDAAGCTDTSSVSVLASNSTLAAAISQPPNLCNGSTATITVNASGGFGGYTYIWSNGATAQSIIVGAGNYCVTVTDAGGCIVNACVTVNQNPPLAASIGTPSFVCQGGTTTVTASATGGQMPYSFLWSTGQTTSSIVVPQGNYTVTVSDATGSSCSTTATVSVSAEPPIVLSLGSTNVGCFGAANGTATVYASGGMPGYSYAWSPSGGSNSTATNLAPATYTVLVTDAIGCPATGTVSISQPASPVGINSSSTDVLCFGQSTGTATASGSGGNAPYYYFWQPNGASTSGISSIPAGTYTVTVSDSTGCYTSASVTVTEPPAISVTSISNPSTCGLNNGSATVSASGGTGALTYTWTPSGGNSSSASNLQPGNYTVTVTDANGCQQQSSVPVSAILSSLNANFSSSTPCQNNSTLFADLSTATNDSIVSYSWVFGEPASGANNNSTLQNPSHTYLAGGNFNVTLIVTTQIGCSDTVTMSAIVNPLPLISFTPDTVCVNTFNVFNNTTTISSGTISSWSWNFGDPASGANNTSAQQNPGHTYVSPGTYTVTLIAVSGSGCSDTASQNVVIMAAPVAGFAATTVCENLPTQFTDGSVATGSSITGWSWNFGDGSPADSTQNPSHIYPSDGTFNVILSAVSANGCVNSDTVAVTVYPLPNANFTAPDVCFNQPTLFTDQSTVTPGGIWSWAWDFGNFTPVNNSQSPNYVYASTGTFNVTLTVTTNFGCAATITQPVTVYSLPVANFAGTTACVNSSLQFTDLSTVPGGGSINGWLWAYGDGSPVGTVQNPTHSYVNPGNYNVSLVVTSGTGCKDTITKPLIVYPAPVAQFAVFDSSGCATYCTQFADASLANGGSITDWSWDFGDGSINGTGSNPNHCYPTSGLYNITLTVTTSNGCTSTLTKNNLITVYPVPVADFTLTPQSTSTLESTISFTDLSIDATGWEWDFGDPKDTNNSSVQHPLHFYADSGNYCVTLTVQNMYQCLDVAVNCLTIYPEFTFYIPNAFTPEGSEGVNDEFSGYGTNIRQYDMWIYDRWGDMIFHTNNLNERWDGHANGGKNIAQQDVYVYLVVLLDVNGNEHKYRGHVTLVR